MLFDVHTREIYNHGQYWILDLIISCVLSTPAAIRRLMITAGWQYMCETHAHYRHC
jgi:hypothetical protein